MVSSITYDSATGRPITTTLPNGVVTTVGYDANRGWATTSAWAGNGTAVASTWSQTKTISGRTTNDSAGGVINRSYAYDGANRLTAASDGGGSRLYAYDRNTNRCGLAATCDGQWTVDQADRLQASPQASSYTYDWRGNLTASTPRPGKTSATQILYDGWDHARLLNDGTTTATTTLDPTGRALRRRVNRNSDSVVLEDTTYGYAGPGDTPAWNRPTGGTTYTTHLGGGATDTAGVPTWPLANPHGDLIGATDTNGTFTPQGLADEFGNGPVNTDRNGWLGTHERTVDHTTLGWYRMGVRLYDPTTGRFHAVDPVEGGSANSYDYVSGDPINATDLDGTRKCIKGGILATASDNHVPARICVVGRNRKERAKGLVRVQFEIRVRGSLQREQTIGVEAVIRADYGNPIYDRASPFDPFHDQYAAHPSILLHPGEAASVFGIAHLVTGNIGFFGYFTTPDESIYDR